jgi:hypothetical protein
MGRLSGDLQSLAIGLLNHADDEGYFLADAAAVRSALRPFDDSSTIVRRGLDELSRAGWIEVREHPTHGKIGWVVNFTKHQRIDRPKASNLKQYFEVTAFDDESTNVRRIVDDESLLEGKGREQGKEGKGTGKAAAALAVESLRKAWNDNTTPPLARWESGRDGIATNALKRRPLEQWVEVFKRINASPFCRGEDGGWKADVDWALRPEGRKPETALKVLEGAYDRATPIRRGPVAAEAVDLTDAQTGELAFD